MKKILSIILAILMVVTMIPFAFAAGDYAVVDTEAGTVTIDGTLGGKTTATEDDVNTLVEQLKGYVDSGITTIIVTGSEPALYNFYGIDTSAVSAALYYLADGRSDSPYCGTIDLILPDVTEIVDDEFNNTFALNSITLPKVTKLGDLAFYACCFIQTIAFGSVVTDVEEGGGVMFHMVGYDVGGCDLVLNCGQMNSSYIPDLDTNTWKFRYENEFKSITLTHTGGEATCIAKAVCETCGESYGELAEHTAEPTYTDNGDGTHKATYSCCGAVVDNEAHTIENHVCTGCGAMEIVVSFNAGDYEWKTGDQINFVREVEGIGIDDCVFTATVAEDGTVTWTADKPFCWYGEGEQKLFAAPNNGWSVDYFVIPEDQSTSAKLDEADLVNGMWVGTPTTDTITFNMMHRMAKVTVNYEFAEGVTADISELKVYSIAQICLFSIDDWSIKLTSAGQYDVWVTPYLDGNQFTAFIIPETYATDEDFIKITLSDGTVYEVKMNKAVTFAEGAEYSYKVIITADGAYLTCADECTFEYTDNGDGTHDATCSACGAVVDNEAHTGGTATCTEQAKCERCGASYGEFDLTNHEGEYVTVWYNDYQHVSEYECCHIGSSVVYEDHDYKDYTITTPADCVNNAWETGTCICGDTHTREIAGSATDHNWSNKDGICANGCGETCPHEKYTDGVCDKCGYECPHTWDEDGYCRKCKTFCKHENNVNGVCTVCDCVLTFSVITGDTVSYYDSFDDALENAEEGSTVKLMKGLEQIASYEINKSITFDLNGNNWDTGSSDYIDVYAFVTFTDSVGTGNLNLSLNLYAPCLFNSGTYKGIGIMFETEDTLDDYLAECHGFFDHYTGEFKDVSDEKYVMGAKVDIYHKLGAQTCKGYQCEECGEYFGEADPDAHDWSNKDGICVICGEECAHEWDEGVLTRPTFETAGYYTYTCTLCGHSYTEPTEKADDTALNDAYMKVTEYIDNDTLTQEAKDEIYKSYRDILRDNGNIFDELGFVRGDLVEEDQPAIDTITEELQKIIADADEKIASGEYVKAEYTEIDEAIDDIEEKLASENVTDEGKAELEEIKKQLEEMKADENTSAADVAELEKALEDYEEELDKGIEDGTLVEIDINKIADEVNKKWAEKLEAEGLLDEYEDFINNQKATDEALAAEKEINDFLTSLEGTVAENAENIAKLNEMLDSLLESWENCLRGTHNFKDYEITSPAKCGKNAVETSICWFCGETDEREVEGSALEHVFGKYTSNGDATCTSDGTKTATCIHGCGATDTVADEGSMIDHSDEDGDKLCDDCQAEIIDACPDCGRPAHEDTGVPMYICIIITFIRLVISFIEAIS